MNYAVAQALPRMPRILASVLAIVLTSASIVLARSLVQF
jgi:hypothetical protein